jgi:ribonuclease P protein component
VTTSAEFQALFQQGKRVERPPFVLLWRDSPGPRRAGFAVSRQVDDSVGRNRVRRRLREAYRIARDAAPPGVALIVVGKARARTMPFDALTAQLRDALAGLHGRRP